MNILPTIKRFVSSFTIKLFIWFWLIAIISIASTRFISQQLSNETFNKAAIQTPTFSELKQLGKIKKHIKRYNVDTISALKNSPLQKLNNRPMNIWIKSENQADAQSLFLLPGKHQQAIKYYINNQLFEGAFGYAGEFGHTKIEGLDRLCNCGGVGCLETVVSANGIKKSYAVNMKEIKSSEPTQIPSVKAIFDKAKNGDTRCQAILYFTFEKLGQKMADFIHILNPQAIIFCGNIAKSMGAYMPIISGFCEAQLLNDFKGKIHYGVSELLDDRMNVLGPASLAFAKAEELVG